MIHRLFTLYGGETLNQGFMQQLIKNKRKLIMLYCLVLVISICFIFTGCNFYDNMTGVYSYQQDCSVFSEYLIDGDRNAVYDMFCKKCKTIDGFYEEYNNVMDQLDLYALDYESMVLNVESGGGSSSRGGELVQWSRTAVMRNIYDADGVEYEIIFGFTGIDKDNPDMEGVYSLSLRRVVDTNQGYYEYDTMLYIGVYSQIQGQERYFYYESV